MGFNSESVDKKYRRVEGVTKKTWDSKKFNDSPVSKKLLEYSDRKFLSVVSIIFLLKCVATVSCKLERPRLSVLHVAPPRQLKSYTSNEVMKIFSKEFWLDLQSDFTANSLKKHKKKLAQNVCMFVNDATTLFASKAKRFKDRLVGALSALLADEIYIYQDFKKKFTLKGWITLIMNMTSESYMHNKNNLLGLTFTERVLTVHHLLTKKEEKDWVKKSQKTAKMKFGSKIKVEDIETNVKPIPKHYLKLIEKLAREFSYISMRSFVGCQDLIKGLARAHAALNKRTDVCSDDFEFVLLVEPYLVDPFSKYVGQIIEHRAQGYSYREICRKIGKDENYKDQVGAVCRLAQLRGILPLEIENGTKSKNND